MSTATAAPRKLLFPAEYIKDLNAGHSAARCGYSKRTAKSQGARLLKDATVQAEITRLQEARAQRSETTADRILAEVDTLALSDIGGVLDFSGDQVRLRSAKEIPESARRAVASIKVKRYLEGKGEDALDVEVTEFKMYDKNASLRLAMQHRGMLTEKHEHTGKDGAPLPPTHVTVRLVAPGG